MNKYASHNVLDLRDPGACTDNTGGISRKIENRWSPEGVDTEAKNDLLPIRQALCFGPYYHSASIPSDDVSTCSWSQLVRPTPEVHQLTKDRGIGRVNNMLRYSTSLARPVER